MYLPNQNTAYSFGIAFNTAGKRKGMKLYAFVFMTKRYSYHHGPKKEETPLWHIIRDFKIHRSKNNPQIQKKKTEIGYYKLMKASGKNGANTQYQFWIQDDGAIEISIEKFFHQKDVTSINPCK